MKRAPKGRFTKEDSDDNNKGYKLSLILPSFTSLIYWIFLFIIIMPLAIILERSNALKKIFDLFEHFLVPQEESENPKKNGIFY